jgi:hypothetical protein
VIFYSKCIPYRNCIWVCVKFTYAECVCWKLDVGFDTCDFLLNSLNFAFKRFRVCRIPTTFWDTRNTLDIKEGVLLLLKSNYSRSKLGSALFSRRNKTTK